MKLSFDSFYWRRQQMLAEREAIGRPGAQERMCHSISEKDIMTDDIGDLTVEGLLAGQEDGIGGDADEDRAEDDGDAEGRPGAGGRRYPQRDRARVQVQHYVPGTGGGLRRAGWGSSCSCEPLRCNGSGSA